MNPTAAREPRYKSYKNKLNHLIRIAKAQFRRRTIHEPNLIQIKAGPNHENPAF